MGVACYRAIVELDGGADVVPRHSNGSGSNSSSHHGHIDTGEDVTLGGIILFWSTALYSMEGICMVSLAQGCCYIAEPLQCDAVITLVHRCSTVGAVLHR
jgi:hypothetical protein